MFWCSLLAQGGVGDVFWLTILLIFVVAIVGALIRYRQKDKCLKLLDDYHVTYLTADGRTIWGDLVVSSQGLELQYDAPYRTRRGLAKNSSLIFTDEYGKCLAICRTVHGLTAEERRDRERQIQGSFNPGLVRRALRWMRSVINIIRDAVTKALGLVAGQFSSRGALGGAVKSQKGSVDELGKTLVGAVGNAYEPILERHIGRPVIVEITNPDGTKPAVFELPGYLVEYSDRFLAVFNVSHEPVEKIELEVTEPVQREGISIDLLAEKVVITCTGEDALVVRQMTCGGQTTDLSVALMPGRSVRLGRTPGEPVKLLIERTRQIDVVCPRSVARVRFGSDMLGAARSGWAGVAPEEEET